MSAWATPARWWDGARLGLAVMAASVIEASPLGFGAEMVPAPDLIFLVVALWALKRPETVAVPVVLIAALYRDLTGDLPIGLGALSMVLAMEALRERAALKMGDWPDAAAFAAVLAGAQAMVWLGVALTFRQPPPLSEIALQTIITLALYPVASVVLRALTGLGRASRLGRL